MQMNLCFCIDENYVCQLGAVLLSLVDTNSNNCIDIYVMTTKLSDKSKDRLLLTIRDVDNFNLFFVDSTDERVGNLKAGGHISSATYIRFDIPDLLSQLDKVLYLDADLVICDDLTEFWSVNIESYFVAAIENPFFDRYKSLNMKPSSGYFNAGVLLINSKLWREHNVKTQALDFLNKNKEKAIMFDQDALNSVFKGQWLKLPLRWNLQTIYLRRRNDLPLLKSEIKGAFEKPGIVHYSSSSKPWDSLDPHPLNYLFKKYAEIFGSQKKPFTIKKFIRSLGKYCYLKIIYTLQLKFN